MYLEIMELMSFYIYKFLSSPDKNYLTQHWNKNYANNFIWTSWVYWEQQILFLWWESCTVISCVFSSTYHLDELLLAPNLDSLCLTPSHAAQLPCAGRSVTEFNHLSSMFLVFVLADPGDPGSGRHPQGGALWGRWGSPCLRTDLSVLWSVT